jgi:ribosomal protein S18 acetylase RimI-like enzyme
MVSPLKIRDARVDDMEELAGFAEAMAWETECKRLDPSTVRRGVGAVFAEPRRGRYYIAERDGHSVGTLMLTYEWSDWRAGDWWWIQSVYVPPEARRQGVFAALYAHVLGAAQASPCVCGLRLYVEHGNDIAQATYQSLGMVDAGYRMLEHELPLLGRAVLQA